MANLLFLNLLISITVSTTDVCCRLFEIREQIESLHIEGTAGSSPFCYGDDMCYGLTVDDRPIPCQAAFSIITRHNERPLDIPPILMPPARFTNVVQRDLSQSLRDLNTSRDFDDLQRMPPELAALIVSLSMIVDEISRRIALMFPRIFFDERVDGRLFQTVMIETNGIEELLHQNDPIGPLVIKHIHRSLWMRKWSFHIHSIVRYIAQLSLVDMELAIISVAPTMHAYFYLCTKLEIDYKLFPKDLAWLQTLLSKYHPLYIADPHAVWVVPTIPGHRWESLEIQLGSDIDWEHFEDIVWDRRRLPQDSGLFAHQFVENILRLENVGRHWSEPGIYDVVQALHRNAYSLRYLGADVDLKTLNATMMSAVTSVVAAFHQDRSSRLRMSEFQMATLLRLTRSQLNCKVLWEFTAHRSTRMRLCDEISSLNVTYIQSNHPNMQEFMSRIHSIDKFRLAQSKPLPWHMITHSLSTVAPRSAYNLYRDSLARIFESAMFIKHDHSDESFFTLNSDVRPVFLVVLGKLIGICLRSPALRSLLIPYFTRSQPTSVFETVFFRSHYVRKGVYYVLPYGVLENMFPDAQALVRSLSCF